MSKPFQTDNKLGETDVSLIKMHASSLLQVQAHNLCPRLRVRGWVNTKMQCFALDGSSECF